MESSDARPRCPRCPEWEDDLSPVTEGPECNCKRRENLHGVKNSDAFSHFYHFASSGFFQHIPFLLKVARQNFCSSQPMTLYNSVA